MSEISEIFMSIEGEGPHTGKPTIYVRYARCNFKCPHFNNPEKIVDQDGYAPAGFIATDYNSLQDIPLISQGCDSQYAVNPKFAHLWKDLSTEQIIDELESLLPPKGWNANGVPTVLSLTGGEPMIRWKEIVKLLSHPRMKDVQHVLIETNCTVPVSTVFKEFIANWLKDSDRVWTWSNSPKLTASGETWKKAIRPSVAVSQTNISDQCEQYFKFVCGADDNDFAEVKKAMSEYHTGGISVKAPIYIMPMACTDQQQQMIAAQVAKMCIEHSYVFCFRIQNAVFANGPGT